MFRLIEPASGVEFRVTADQAADHLTPRLSALLDQTEDSVREHTLRALLDGALVLLNTRLAYLGLHIDHVNA